MGIELFVLYFLKSVKALAFYNYLQNTFDNLNVMVLEMFRKIPMQQQCLAIYWIDSNMKEAQNGST